MPSGTRVAQLGKVEKAVSAVERVCASAASADELLEGLADVVHQVVPHDGSTWFGVDPVTMLATAPARVEGLEPGLCDTFWHLEFHEQDTAQFADLARGDGTSALRLMLDDRPTRSMRYRDFMQPQGYDDELRSVFRTGSSAWGVVGLYRDGAHRAFDDDDVEIMRSLSAPVASALRAHAREASSPLGPSSAPGMLVVDRDGRLVFANAEALEWSQELWAVSPILGLVDGGTLDELGPDDRGPAVPTCLHALVARARAVAEGRERAPSRLRLRDRRGRWLVLHASALSGRGGADDGSVAIVIEAAKSSEIAPIIIEAYALTPREREVIRLLAEGLTNSQLAERLFISPRTAAVHVSNILAKLGMSSRTEVAAWAVRSGLAEG